MKTRHHESAAWRRNQARYARIQEKGVAVDLPLFDQRAAASAEPIGTEAMPKSIPVATDTRDLANIVARLDMRIPKNQQDRVLAVLKQYGPLTNREIADKTGILITTVCIRNYELRQDGKIAKCDEKRQCQISGMVATTWRAI